MSPTVQRPVVVTSPLGEDVLLALRVFVTEELGRLGRFELDLLSEKPSLALEDLLGKGMGVQVELPNGSVRHLHGMVTRFSQVGRVGRLTLYRAIVSPWLWILTRTRDCRIFPDPSEAPSMTVPDIVAGVFRAHGFSDFQNRLHRRYQPREFCVQYRESAFDFVSRLMEEEGIYHYVRHEEGRHELVLADSPESHDEIPGCEEVPYFGGPIESVGRPDHIATWSVAREIQTGVYSSADYDFEIPRADMAMRSGASQRHEYAELEAYDGVGSFVGAYVAAPSGDRGDQDARNRGETFARVRLEEQQVDSEQLFGTGNVRGLAVGGIFRMKGCDRADQNRSYLVTSARHQMEVGGYEGLGPERRAHSFRCEFSAIPSEVPFRARCTTPRPFIAGPQTATVVGKSGEEIWTDVHGRIKVQFHWDRRGKKNENSSCWVRVAQPWAGGQWGSVSIPRIGHEVVVEFIDGNPDRPIVTGCVYNGRNKPPYTLPDLATRSGLRTRSTKDGNAENCNEIYFEDKKGEEQLYIHAEKNQDISVENDETHTVGHDRTKTIENDETTSVKKNRTESVGENESISIGGNRKESVGKDESITVSGARTESVAKNESISIDGARTLNVAKDQSVTIGQNHTVDVGKDESVTIGANRTANVAKNEDCTVGQNQTVSIGKNARLDVGKALQITAADEIVLKTGSASITMKKNGDVTIQGNNITLKGSGNVVLKGSKVTQN